MSAILSDGVAYISDDVSDQLKVKHPSRPAAVRLPSWEQIMLKRADKVDDPSLDVEMKDPKESGFLWDETKEAIPDTQRKNFPSLIINSEQILIAARKAND